MELGYGPIMAVYLPVTQVAVVGGVYVDPVDICGAV